MYIHLKKTTKIDGPPRGPPAIRYVFLLLLLGILIYLNYLNIYFDIFIISFLFLAFSLCDAARRTKSGGPLCLLRATDPDVEAKLEKLTKFIY